MNCEHDSGTYSLYVDRDYVVYCSSCNTEIRRIPNVLTR